MSEDQPLRVDSSDKVRAITSPLRRSFVDALAALGRGSVREVAERLGKPAATLYYHLRQLEEAGVVRAVAERPTGKRPETLYELVSDHFEVASPTRDPQWRAEVRRHIRQELRELERGLGHFIDDPAFGQDPQTSRFQFRALRVQLGAEDLRELAGRLEELTRFLVEAEKRASRDVATSHVVIAFAPAQDSE